MKERIFAKALNSIVTRDKFVDRDVNEYIYASLSQPPLNVVNKHNSNDELDWDVICPNCGRVANYGKRTRMISGYIYCDNSGCRDKLIHILGKQYD